MGWFSFKLLVVVVVGAVCACLGSVMLAHIRRAEVSQIERTWTEPARRRVPLAVAVLFKTRWYGRHMVSLWHYDSDSSAS